MLPSLPSRQPLRCWYWELRDVRLSKRRVLSLQAILDRFEQYGMHWRIALAQVNTTGRLFRQTRGFQTLR